VITAMITSSAKKDDTGLANSSSMNNRTSNP